MNIKNTLLKIVFCFLVWNATILFSHAQQQIQQKFDCFSIVVGKDASVDGSVIVGHNEDTGTALVNFYKVPEGNSPAGETVNIRNGGKIVRSAENLGYLWLNRPESDVCDSSSI